MIAGANFVSTAGGSDQPFVGPMGPPPAVQAGAGGVTIDGTASATGGSVILANGSSIDASGGIAGAAGGDVLIAAFANPNNLLSGEIDLGSTNISTSSDQGQSGNITIIGGGNGNGITSTGAFNIDQ